MRDGMGWETLPLTSTKQGKIGALVEQVGELTFCRTQSSSEIIERFFGANIYAN
jgi:hypothetical protein